MTERQAAPGPTPTEMTKRQLLKQAGAYRLWKSRKLFRYINWEESHTLCPYRQL